MKRVASALCLALLVAACSPPSAPDDVIPSQITVTGGDLLLVGASEMFTAAGDPGVPLVVQWGSDAPSVATVDTTGRVTAVGTGTATIFADARGIRGTKLIRTLPNFQGSWNVTIRVTRCEASGGYLSNGYWCAYPPPNYAGHDFTLIQARDRVSGGFSIHDYDFTGIDSTDLAGSVSADGILSFTATGSGTGPGTVQVHNVRFASFAPGQLTGTLEQVWSGEGGSGGGSVRYFCELTSARRR